MGDRLTPAAESRPGVVFVNHYLALDLIEGVAARFTWDEADASAQLHVQSMCPRFDHPSRAGSERRELLAWWRANR